MEINEVRDTLEVLKTERRRLIDQLNELQAHKIIEPTNADAIREAQDRLTEMDQLFHDLWRKCTHKKHDGTLDCDLVTHSCRVCGRIFTKAQSDLLQKGIGLK